MAVGTAANRTRIITWSRVRDDVGLTNQVCALKTRSGIQNSRRAVQLPFQSTFNVTKVSDFQKREFSYTFSDFRLEYYYMIIISLPRASGKPGRVESASRASGRKVSRCYSTDTTRGHVVTI